MNRALPIYVAGHQGLVGSAIVRALIARGFANLLLADRAKLDLTNQDAVTKFFNANRPAYVFLAAARVGGIQANSTYPAEFIRDNLAIQLNVLEAARVHGCRKFMMLGSSCIYPRLADQPIREESFLTGPLEPTNAPYAIAKIAGIAMCQAFARQYGMNCISAMPTNLYGPGDNFDLHESHVIPALMRKVHQAKITGARSVTVWGTGSALREFLFVDDLADAALFLMERYDSADLINVGSGTDLSIRHLAEEIAHVIGYNGEFVFDQGKHDGTPRKLLDVSKLTRLGWTARVPLREGLERTYDWFIGNMASLRGVDSGASGTRFTRALIGGNGL